MLFKYAYDIFLINIIFKRKNLYKFSIKPGLDNCKIFVGGVAQLVVPSSLMLGRVKNIRSYFEYPKYASNMINNLSEVS